MFEYRDPLFLAYAALLIFCRQPTHTVKHGTHFMFRNVYAFYSTGAQRDGGPLMPPAPPEAPAGGPGWPGAGRWGR